MPCSDGGQYIEDLGKSHSNLTRLLCEVMKAVNEFEYAEGGISPFPQEARDWFVKHEEQDRRREADEKECAERARLQAEFCAKLYSQKL